MRIDHHRQLGHRRGRDRDDPRSTTSSAEILVISEEPHMIYSRPMLSHYLAGEMDRRAWPTAAPISTHGTTCSHCSTAASWPSIRRRTRCATEPRADATPTTSC